MKLIGSKREREIESQLRHSQSWLLEAPETATIRSVLLRAFKGVQSALLLNWTPDQSEDLYSILVNGSSIASFEIPREIKFDPQLIEVELEHPLEWKKHLRGQVQNLKYLIAMQIADETLGSAAHVAAEIEPLKNEWLK